MQALPVNASTTGSTDSVGDYAVAIKMTLEEALREALQDDDKISKYEAEVIHEFVLADGKMTASDKELLRKALKDDHFDDKAFAILSDLLVRTDAKM